MIQIEPKVSSSLSLNILHLLYSYPQRYTRIYTANVLDVCQALTFKLPHSKNCARNILLKDSSRSKGRQVHAHNLSVNTHIAAEKTRIALSGSGSDEKQWEVLRESRGSEN